ncbi:MAG TPA: DNA mismatch endonuclease Vsr [Rubrivivax sp.]|nr:DNA mismatch endonuclease Vsr [Rubrivivax sp.]
MDTRSVEERSPLMARVRSTGNVATELRFIALMKQGGITGWRRHIPLLGRPDFTFRRERVVIFVDGCFWHGCPRCYKAPRSNQTYWAAKVEANKARDQRVRRRLRQAGWHVMRVWQHQLAHQPQTVAWRLLRILGREAAL